MSRTYWAKRGERVYEFLGAYSDGHVSKGDGSPQATGSIIDFEGMSIQNTLDRLNDRAILMDMPSKIANKLDARMPQSIPFDHVDPFLRKGV